VLPSARPQALPTTLRRSYQPHTSLEVRPGSVSTALTAGRRRCHLGAAAASQLVAAAAPWLSRMLVGVPACALRHSLQRHPLGQPAAVHSHRRMTGGATSHTAAAWRTEVTFSGRLTTRTLAAPHRIEDRNPW
jgi:hypothetical protein